MPAPSLPRSIAWITVALAVAASLTTAADASAEPMAACPMKKAVYTGDSPRVQHGSLDVEGRAYEYTVLLPSDYETADRSYPVLYWLHGAGGSEDYVLTAPDTPGFIEQVSADEPVIIVMPDGGFVGMYSDWPGEPDQQWETFHIDNLVPHVDATYRTIADRGHRAVAGLSMGGMGALKYAARHPELFGAAASFSGLLDTSFRSPAMKTFLTGAGPVLVPLCTGSRSAFGPWGDPVLGRRTWERHNPTALAPRLRGTSVYASTGNGVPCDRQDTEVLASESPTNPLRAMEPVVAEANHTFHRAMRRAGIPMRFDAYGCGLHSWRYWERSFTTWWPMMRSAFDGRSSRLSTAAHRRPSLRG